MARVRVRRLNYSSKNFNLGGQLNIEAENTARYNDVYTSPLRCSYTSSVSTSRNTLISIKKDILNTELHLEELQWHGSWLSQNSGQVLSSYLKYHKGVHLDRLLIRSVG